MKLKSLEVLMVLGSAPLVVKDPLLRVSFPPHRGQRFFPNKKYFSYRGLKE